MTAKTDAYLRGLAQDALQQAAVVEPPVPVDSVALALGVPVRLVRLPSFFHGSVVNEDGMPVVLLNAERPEHQQRAALAHLVGHILLVMAGESYPRNGIPRHERADAVGREVLLPADIVAEQAALWFNDHRYLARLFGVSERDMLDRMRELGLVRQDERVLWDY